MAYLLFGPFLVLWAPSPKFDNCHRRFPLCGRSNPFLVGRHPIYCSIDGQFWYQHESVSRNLFQGPKLLFCRSSIQYADDGKRMIVEWKDVTLRDNRPGWKDGIEYYAFRIWFFGKNGSLFLKSPLSKWGEQIFGDILNFEKVINNYLKISYI